MKRIALPALAAILMTGAGHASNRDGLAGINKTQSAQTLGKGRFQVSAFTHVTNDEELFVNGETTRNGNVEWTPYFLIADSYFNLAYGIVDRLDIALGMPIYYEEINNSWNSPRGYDFAELLKAYSPGGLKLSMKLRLFSSNEQPWGAALMLGASAPPFARAGDGIVPRGMEFLPLNRTATNDGSRAFGTDQVETRFSLALTGDFTKLPSKIPLIWHLNGGMRKVGFQIADERDFDDVLSGSTALEFAFHRYFRLAGELYHETRLNQIELDHIKTEPSTVTLIGTASTPIGLSFQAGVVFGILNEGSTPVEHRDANGRTLETFGMRGSVPVSLVAGLSWTSRAPNPDTDKDGILNKADQCPLHAEDKDAFQDEDGCPDGDNDADGIADVRDQCPDRAEDVDGFKDEDGCIDPDNDADGIADLLDKCPGEAEDMDGFQDEDGCPDPDNDQDGFTDALDKCPSQAETKNGFEDEDGCPDEVIKKGAELVLQGVFFKTGSAELTPESVPVLEQLIGPLLGAPEIRLEIQGHTDNVGSAVKNKRLSQKRAEAVMAFLIYKGVAKERLRAVGYGAEKPVGNNKTAAGRSQNRRVELLRLE